MCRRRLSRPLAWLQACLLYTSEVMGLDEVPTGGDKFDAVSDEKLARELVEQRKHPLQKPFLFYVGGQAWRLCADR